MAFAALFLMVCSPTQSAHIHKWPQHLLNRLCTTQAELQTVTGALAALDDDLDMIQQQLEHQMQAQDQNQDDARYGAPSHPMWSFWVKSCIVMQIHQTSKETVVMNPWSPWNPVAKKPSGNVNTVWNSSTHVARQVAQLRGLTVG